MAALLVALNIMAVALTVALPLWKTVVQREKEAELVFRGQQYARAIGLFQRKYANAFPPNLDILLTERFLRKKYKDPITNGEFQLLYASGQGAPGQVGQVGQPGRPQPPGQTPPARQGASPLDAGARGPAGTQGGIMGVASKSTETSLRLYNGRSKYNEWAFVYMAANTGVGAPGAQRPGAPPGQGGRPGTPNVPTAPGTPRVSPPGAPRVSPPTSPRPPMQGGLPR